MNFSLIFENSGDEIPFFATNPGLLEYFVDTINNNYVNKFSYYPALDFDGRPSRELVKNVTECIQSLQQESKNCNEWIQEIMEWRIPILEFDEYLDQQNLNKLHEQVVNWKYDTYEVHTNYREKGPDSIAQKLHDMFSDDITSVTFGCIISRLGLEKEFNRINLLLHRLENQFTKVNFKVDSVDRGSLEFDNPFPTNIVTNNICNLSLTFWHLGRALYDKFQKFDLNYEYDDENTFSQLTGSVELNLLPPETIPFSKEYVAWCNRNNKVPSGTIIELGNIPNLYENLTKYRKIVFHNLLSNNAFSIQKG